MGLLDVSEVLLDPDFTDRIDVRRVMVVPNDHGVGEPHETTHRNIVAVVTQGSGDTLKRIDAGAMISGSITVHTRFRLLAADTDDMTADVVTFRGREYTVTLVSDYSNFGRGFWSAVCDLKALNPT